MVRKTTSSKSAAKKADARKRVTPKAGARASSSTAKAAMRKGQPAKNQTKRVVKVVQAKLGSSLKITSVLLLVAAAGMALGRYM